MTGSGEEVGPADDDAGADPANSTSSCIAPSDPAVVDEHPATPAVTSTNPPVSSFMPVLIAVPDLSRWGCESPRRLFDEGYPGKVPGKVTMFTEGSQPPCDILHRKPCKARGRPASVLPDPQSMPGQAATTAI